MGLIQDLQRHDWWCMMSDDYNVTLRGEKRARLLQHRLRQLDCPYAFWDIYKALHNMNTKVYLPVPGKENLYAHRTEAIYRKVTRRELITAEESEAINRWLIDAEAVEDGRRQEAKDNE